MLEIYMNTINSILRDIFKIFTIFEKYISKLPTDKERFRNVRI